MALENSRRGYVRGGGGMSMFWLVLVLATGEVTVMEEGLTFDECQQLIKTVDTDDSSWLVCEPETNY